MSEANTPEASYILGHSEAEITRLQTQATILRPITERLLRSAGILPGMRVLDLGSGAGDAAMLAAELVGPSGSVVGIDRNSQVLSIATERASRAGLKHLSFHEADVETFVDDIGFDVVMGRYVSMHQNDPVAFLRPLRGWLDRAAQWSFMNFCCGIRGVLFQMCRCGRRSTDYFT